MLRLPKELEERIWNEMQVYEEERKMPYVTSVERIGIRKEWLMAAAIPSSSHRRPCE
jgi:hypothetical protein